MATYKVPQDVEADDKLLGPFTFRQFIYLMVVFGLVMLAIALFQIFPLLAIIPIPFALFFAILALPIRKDQHMETYLAALLSFYTKPNRRYWVPGMSESTIEITAPKKTEANRARDITQDEASHRLSFLAELVDSEGHAIKNASTTMKDDFYAEAAGVTDMFERHDAFGLENSLIQEREERRDAVINQMRTAIDSSQYNHDNPDAIVNQVVTGQRVIKPRSGFTGTTDTLSGFESPSVVQPVYSTPESMTQESPSDAPLGDYGAANNSTGSAYLDEKARAMAEEAERVQRENDSEVFVSLH